MATFEAQVEGLTSLSIDGSSAPTQTELTQFLTDGAAEVINAMPRNLKLLCATEDTFTSTAVGSEAETLESGQILQVTRSDGTIEQPCREIPAMQRGRASDSDDMNAASATDPVYYVYNGKINALPASGSCKYLEVNNPAVAYGDSSVSNFPDEYEYLIPLYASVKALQNTMGGLLESDLSISASAPSVPSIGTVSYSAATNADASSTAVGAITVATVSKADISGDVPAYTKPSTSVNFGTLSGSDSSAGTEASLGFDDFIASEDPEMAAISLQKQQELLRAHQIDIQNELNEFNKENTRYQANVQSELAKHNSDLQKALRQAQIDAADAQQEAAQATDVSKFNKSQDQVLALQNAAQTMQATMQNNDDVIQKFLAEMNRYTALVNTEVQTYVQNFQNNAQKFQNAQVQQAKLQADYDKGIQLMRGG